jgi:hypothetical protein
MLRRSNILWYASAAAPGRRSARTLLKSDLPTGTIATSRTQLASSRESRAPNASTRPTAKWFECLAWRGCRIALLKQAEPSMVGEGNDTVKKRKTAKKKLPKEQPLNLSGVKFEDALRSCSILRHCQNRRNNSSRFNVNNFLQKVTKKGLTNLPQKRSLLGSYVGGKTTIL